MNTLTATEKEQLSDEEVIGRILSGEPRLYEVVMRRYNAMLYRVGMSIVNNDTDMEDIMQTAYIKAYEKLSTFEHRSGLGTWLTKILINESLHHVKKKKRHIAIEMSQEINMDNKPDGNTASPARALLNKELSKMLEDALVQLPLKYRLVFILREVENRSTAETVSTLNITEANVKVRLNRAKSMLRDSLSAYYKNDGIYHFHLSRCDRIVNNVLLKLGLA
jgi:RNA polymerase sigma factor (sigma-70 family)